MRPIHGKKPNHGQQFKKTQVSEQKISFSFLYFDPKDEELCPRSYRDGYVFALMERLRVLSNWTVMEFVSKYQKNIRNHKIDWSDTSRATGFVRMKSEHKAAEAYQFCVDDHNFGRVHGIFVGDVFFVVWLDHNHKLYPGKPPDWHPNSR